MKKAILLLIYAIIIQYSTNAQQEEVNIKTALVIIDIQNFYFPDSVRPGLVGAEEASMVAKDVLQIFRDKKQLVVHVRHKSNNGFEIHENVKPVSGEKVITKEEVNSFLGTDLLEYLKSNGINRLVIIGMQTHMCLEAAVRAAHDYGFNCIVIQDACATRDLNYGDEIVKACDVHSATLSTISGGGYAKVVDMSEFIKNPYKYLFQEFE